MLDKLTTDGKVVFADVLWSSDCDPSKLMFLDNKKVIPIIATFLIFFRSGNEIIGRFACFDLFCQVAKKFESRQVWKKKLRQINNFV